MEAFRMEIAGVAVQVNPMFQSTIEYCRPYLTNREPEFTVTVTQTDLISEQLLLEQEAVEEGLKIRKFKEPFLERSTIQRRVADYLISHDTLMLHGSTVAVDGYAYLFTAPCGTLPHTEDMRHSSAEILYPNPSGTETRFPSASYHTIPEI